MIISLKLLDTVNTFTVFPTVSKILLGPAPVIIGLKLLDTVNTFTVFPTMSKILLGVVPGSKILAK